MEDALLKANFKRHPRRTSEHQQGELQNVTQAEAETEVETKAKGEAQDETSAKSLSPRSNSRRKSHGLAAEHFEGFENQPE